MDLLTGSVQAGPWQLSWVAAEGLFNDAGDIFSFIAMLLTAFLICLAFQLICRMV